MRKIVLIFCFFMSGLSVFSEKNEKSGLTFGALPAVSYDSDLGFQYGALINFYLYGNAARFPNYDHSLYLELSTYTKGTTIARVRYDSEKLIPKVRTTFDVSYVTDQMSDFYGFNGFQSVYDPSLVASSNRLFYKNEKNMFRAKADFQGYFGESKFGWIAGYSFYHFAVDTVNIRKLNIEKTGETLYEKYKNWGLVNSGEASGGSINYFKAGLKYDSRDQLACPTKGVFTEAVIQTAPKFVNESFPHTKLAIIHRQYFTLTKDLLFAYRLDYQMSLGNNHVPYYAQPLLITSYLTAATNQGLGGKTSIRGILRNRVIGDNVGFGNFEFRYKFLHFEFMKQSFYLGTNVFFDTGLILKPVEMNLTNLSLADKNTYFKNYEAGQFHSAAGLGLKIGWNENFVISADFGKAFDKEDGEKGFYFGLNYLF